MPKLIFHFIPLAFLCLVTASCAQPGTQLHASFNVGEFTGNAAESFTRRLSAHGTWMRASALPTLVGVADYAVSLHPAQETVSTMEEGDLIVHWVNEPLTGEVWLVEEPDTKWVPKDFSYEKLHGKLTISWKLIGQEGDLLAEGTNDYNITRSLGGPLANRRGATVQSPDSLARDALAELCETAASNITEILGPLHAEGDLAPAGDNLSVNARNLVALGNWEEASALWEELLTLNPNYPQALYNLGLFYERKGDLTQAAAYFRRAFLNDQSSRYRNALTRVTAVLRPPDLR